MSDAALDKDRRNWIAITCGAGAIGGATAVVPFVSTFAPSERAKAAGAPVRVDIGALQPGDKMTVEWRGKPVWVMRRTPEQLKSIKHADALVADPNSDRKTYPVPEYAKNEYRSIKPEYLVAVGICPHLGCSPVDKFQPGAQPSCPMTGKAVFCVPATARPSTWPAASSRTSPRPTTSRFRRTCTCPTAFS